MPEKMSKRETSRSRSGSPRSTPHLHMKDRSRTPDRRRKSITPDRRKCSRNRYSKEKNCKSRSRTRSRTPRRYKAKYSESRSRSRSYSPFERRSFDRRKSYSRSPLSQRRRHEHPQQSRCLGVFGLSIYTTEQKINQIFSKYGPMERVQVVIDAKTGKSRGFCFVYFESSEDAKVAKDQCSGMEIDGRRIRVDYSITQRAHTPTPGVYMGKPTRMYRGREYHDRYRDEEYYKEKHRTRERLSPSPHYRDRRRRYERSRSRSYTPRDRRYR